MSEAMSSSAEVVVLCSESELGSLGTSAPLETRDVWTPTAGRVRVEVWVDLWGRFLREVWVVAAGLVLFDVWVWTCPVLTREVWMETLSRWGLRGKRRCKINTNLKTILSL